MKWFSLGYAAMADRKYYRIDDWGPDIISNPSLLLYSSNYIVFVTHFHIR